MAKKRKITAEDLYSFHLMTGARLSPNGKFVVYTDHRVEKKTEKKYSNLFLISLEDDHNRQFTFGNQIDSSPEWSPDSKTIAFLSNRSDAEKPSQIYLINLEGGEARPLTKFEGNIDGFSWSPDGKKIVFTAVKFDPEQIEREKDEQKKKLGVVARHYKRLFFKLDGFGYLPQERLHIWVVDVADGKMKQLTDHEVFDESDPVWSPDGKRLAFFSNRSVDPDNDTFATDLFTMPAKGGDFTKIPTPRGSKYTPSYSPDGKWIAYYGAENEGKMYKNTSLWVVPSDGSKPPKNLTEKFGFDVGEGVINDMGHTENMPPLWSKDGSKVFFRICEHGSSILKSVDVQQGTEITIIEGSGDIGSVCFDQDQTMMSYFYGKMDDTGQLYVMDIASGQSRKLTKHNKKLLSEIDLGEVEEFWYKGGAGNDLQGWILKPPDFDAEKKYPCIIEIHGGPWAMYGNFFMHEFYYLAANGYVVCFTNPRGGKGYGEDHAAAITSNWGGPDYDDMMAFADIIEKKPYIAKKRMGVTGGSYGGYMTNWIIGHTDRFKAAVTQRSVSNLISMWGSSDFNYEFQQESGNKAPYEDIELMWKMSPIKYLGNAKTPTLVIHSEMDLRCAIEQGEQVFVALKRLGVDTEMVRFPNEPHGLSRTGRTDRRIARLNHILRWFDKYLK